MSKVIIHKRHLYKEVMVYFFTKSKNRCLRIEYDANKDYGKTASGCSFRGIEIHYYNSWIKDELTEIKIEDVPKVVRDVLTYLS